MNIYMYFVYNYVCLYYVYIYLYIFLYEKFFTGILYFCILLSLIFMIVASFDFAYES